MRGARMAQLALSCAMLGAQPSEAQAPPATRLRSDSGRACGDTLRFRVQLSGRTVGSAREWRECGGARVVAEEFSDRGRSPSIVERAWLDTSALPRAVEVHGTDLLGAPVAERYRVANGRAEWSSGVDSGSTSDTAAFYLAAHGPRAEMAMLARALLRAPARRVALLPGGSASLAATVTRTVGTTAGARAATAYVITGIGYQPTIVWLDAEYELVLQGGSGFHIVREGWETGAAGLFLAQDSILTAGRRALASVARNARSDALVIRGARMFDAEAATMRDGMSILIKGRTIAAVGPDREIAVPRGAQTIDARGQVALPGLWDMHGHTSEDSGLLYLLAGITTVRDMGGGDPRLAVRRRMWFDADSILGPHLLLAGMIDGEGPMAGPTPFLAKDSASLAAAVDTLAALGFQQIKLYGSFPVDLVRTATTLAHRRQLRVSGHVPAFMNAEQAVSRGFDEINHANYLFLDLWLRDVPDTRGLARVTAVAERAGSVDLGSGSVRALIDSLRVHRTVLDPTLNVFERIFVARAGEILPGYRAAAETMPPAERRGLLLGGLPAPPGRRAAYDSAFIALLRMTKLAYDAGIPIVAGTDGLPGVSLPRELELLVEAGVPARAVLQLATLGAARVMGMDRSTGSLFVGKTADVLLVRGDPSIDIRAVRNVSAVIKAGRVYPVDAMRAAAGMTTRP
jgi:hypothetical protein